MFDALTSPRSYRNARSVSQALGILVDSCGYELDPEAVRGISRWLHQVAADLGKSVEQLTTADLVHPQEPLTDRPASLVTAVGSTNER
jgi:HD-GYP domain-containing protein (c-di-GMP phosphodiesterase class II)